MAEKTAALPLKVREASVRTGEKSLATRDETRYIAPPVDIYETEDTLVVAADLPGSSKDGIEIRVEDSSLTIKGRADYDPRAHHSPRGVRSPRLLSPVSAE